MGGKTQTSTSQQSTTPAALQQLQQIYGTIAGAASTPYQAYTGELTAPVNAQQQTGIDNINANANYASPFISQAGQLATSAANPLTASQIEQYSNPFTDSVVNATQAQFNEQNGQQQQQVLGNAAAQGALGGDRSAVAQAILAGQQQTAQAPVIAGLQQAGYNSALQTAQQQYQANPLAAASTIGNIGIAGQNAALSGANAQVGAGTLQQQTQQTQDTAALQQWMQQQGYPYQSAAFLAQYGLPTALGMGSSSSGTQTTQGPSLLSQIAGLGLTAAGIWGGKKDGGRVGYASGGSPYDVPNYVLKNPFSYIPTGGAPSGNLQTPSLQYAKPQQADMKPISTAISKLPSLSGPAWGGGSFFGGDAYGGSSSNPLPGLDASDYGAGYSDGGFVDAVHHISHAIRRARGGVVDAAPGADGVFRVQGYDDGGGIPLFSDRFDAAYPAMQAPVAAPPISPDQDVVNPDSPFWKRAAMRSVVRGRPI